MKKTSPNPFKDYSSIVIKSYVYCKVFFYLLLELVLKAHKLCIIFYSSHNDMLLADKLKDIILMQEMYGMHSFDKMQLIINALKYDEGIIFRNFCDCQ